MNLTAGLNALAKQIQKNNAEKGFWDKERNVGELLMLVTSELGEALDAHQKGKFAAREAFFAKLDQTDSEFIEHAYPAVFTNNIKDSFEDEIADAIIRLLDLSAGLQIDIEWYIAAKLKYNTTREKLHGKNY